MREFTDAVVQNVFVTVQDAAGRSASISFADDGIIVHRSRPLQGKKVEIPYTELLNLVASKNAKFFDRA
ncbi:hypothetical protein [Sphingomonas antarctica]|uniref:hypothetical protein n=1 Tax=Sphingomonas antarctica TaxID=2040274 RepID=UPI0039ED1A96